MKTLQWILAGVFLLMCLGATAQPGDLDSHNEVIRRANQRLAEIKKLTDVNDDNTLKSKRGLKLVANEIEAKHEIARALASEIGRIDARINADARQIRKLGEDLDGLKEEYGKFVYAAWKNHKMMNTTAFLLAARDFNDATRRISYIRRYNRARVEKGLEIDSLNSALQARLDEMEERKTELGSLKTENDTLMASLAKDEARYEAALKVFGANDQKYKDDAKKERDKIAAAQREIDKIMAEQARAEKARIAKAGVSQADVALSGRFEENKGKLPWPTGGPGTVLDHFGIERMADGIEKDSKGITIAAQRGDRVRAVFEGVAVVYGLDQFGKCVMVRSGSYVVVYANLAETGLKSGDTVVLGQTVGTLSDSEDTGRHTLLFQIWYETTALNPEQWLRK